ncbi:hypothetical protein [Paludibacterium paludis]|uniref:Uncharacterized protein n=1 Tax=Paludibacterium paludis TaxID=1225769 RepID=A0A918U737_9NEIS|nr:hypothetical protein [Paludibacterium paludis]GGY03994.1 hypothetical protein GCM10011289_02970 [Paludibacterium paludis]
MLRRIVVPLTIVLMHSTATAQNVPKETSAASAVVMPVKQISLYVLPYYESASSPGGRPSVNVGYGIADQRLPSGKQEDILAVRDAIEANPERITPMTIMALAFRLYDVGLRDDAVFWFYVAKNRYATLLQVLDMTAPGLVQAAEASNAFVLLGGETINGYAFCDIAKQRDIKMRAIAWVEQHPYAPLFFKQLPALPGDRAENLKQSIANLKTFSEKEQQFLDDAKNLEQFQKKRREWHAQEKFCWS